MERLRNSLARRRSQRIANTLIQRGGNAQHNLQFIERNQGISGRVQSAENTNPKEQTETIELP